MVASSASTCVRNLEHFSRGVPITDNIILSMEAGTRVKVWNRTEEPDWHMEGLPHDHWYAVETEGGVGWMYAPFLQVDELWE